MSSIYLSFKEWPYLTFHQLPQTQQLKSPTLTSNKIEILKSVAPVNIVSTMNYSNANPIKRSASSILNEQNPTYYPNNNNNPNQLFHLSAWGRCGLFACTFESCLCIFTADENDCLTPIIMFSPFERFTIGKISKRHPKKALITAIGWSNGYLQPSLSKPYLAVSSEKGHLLIYDINSKEIIGNIRFNDQITTILWSSFKLNRFYAGSITGHFYICDLEDKNVQIIKTHEFNAQTLDLTETVPKSIDFITQDDVDGSIVAISSKDGSVGYITNMNDPLESKLHVFQNLPFKSFNVAKKNPNIVINFFKFYPNNKDFITIATNVSTFLISLSKGILIPFIQTPNCKFISVLDNQNNKVIVGDDNDLTVWKLVDHFWHRSNILKIGDKFGLTEILSFTQINNKILLTTASNWLTEVDFRREKLFISKRIKLINGIPIDYDFGNGSIAMLTNSNTISFTEFTPESVIKSYFAKERQDSSDDSTSMFQMVDDSSVIEEYNEPISYSTASKGNGSLTKSNSMTFEVGSDTSRAFQHLFKKEKIDFNKTSDTDSSFIRSESDYFGKNSSIKYNGNESLIGTSNSFSLSFRVPKNNVIKNIEWISPQKLVAWSKKAFFLIDLSNRVVLQQLLKKFDPKCNTLTQIFFSKTRRFLCLVLNNNEAHIIDVESDFSIIKSINFEEKINNNQTCLFGCISPNEEQVVFVSQNFLFFDNLKDKKPMKQIISSLEFNASFILWKKHGILIGTEKGNVFLITNKKIEEILKISKINNRDVKVIFDSSRSGKKRLGSIKYIASCINDGLIILDSNEQGIIYAKNGGIKTIADGIKSFKKCSKETALIRLQNYDKLVAINLMGGDFSPPPPPCDYILDNQLDNLLESINDNSISNQLFLTDENNPSVSLRNNACLLNQIISIHDPFSSLSLKTFLMLGNVEKALDLLLKTDPNDKDYLNNMMIASHYESNSNDEKSIQLVLKKLLDNNFVDLAIGILLITKNTYSAVETLFKLGKVRDAYNVLMLSDYKNYTLNDLVKNIANYLFAQKESVIYGLKLLASFGCIDELVYQLSLNLK